VIINANIALLRVSHISRARHAHQVTACALYILMQRVYSGYLQSFEEPPKSFDEWKKRRIEASPPFHYWYLVMELELTVLTFVQSIQQGDLVLYCDSLKRLITWFFALDHIHYARWLSVHLRDMLALPDWHPQIAEEFRNGKFVIHKTQNPFSAIALNHAHEQNNKIVKGDGRAVGLTESSSELLRWMVSGPEIARMVSEFKDAEGHGQGLEEDDTGTFRHHEEVKSKQAAFQKEVNGLCKALDELGNPFGDPSSDRIVVDTGDVANSSVVSTVDKVKRIGEDSFDAFVERRLVKRETSLFEPIHKNNLSLFSKSTTKKNDNNVKCLKSFKEDCTLFAQSFISCQIRGADLSDFFGHENHTYPPSLAKFGSMHSCAKSDLAKCLEELSPSYQSDPPLVETVILDSAAIVNMLNPGHFKTFQQYGEDVFLSYVQQQLKLHVNRIDIVGMPTMPTAC